MDTHTYTETHTHFADKRNFKKPGMSRPNEALRELLPKKSNCIYCSFHSKRCFYQLYSSNKMDHFSYGSGCPIRVVKFLKEDWPVILQ